MLASGSSLRAFGVRSWLSVCVFSLRRQVAEMKRSPIIRKTALRSRRKPVDSSLERQAWKEPHAGLCQCGCNPPSFGQHLERHHVIALSFCKREGLPLWDLANSMLLTPRHHALHTHAYHRIPIEAVPEPAIRFALEWLGEDRAHAYLSREYDCSRNERWAA